MVNFRVDPTTMKALEKLEAAAGDGLFNSRSLVIRRAIIEAAARLDDKDKK